MTQPSRQTSRMFAASICLLAVMFGYAPLAAAAWSAYAAACCEDGMCTIPGPHHSKARSQAADGNCNHSDGLAKHAMFCCRDSERFGVTSFAFVLPALILVPVENRDAHCWQAASHVNIANPVEPTSPPPRTDAAVL